MVDKRGKLYEREQGACSEERQDCAMEGGGRNEQGCARSSLCKRAECRSARASERSAVQSDWSKRPLDPRARTEIAALHNLFIDSEATYVRDRRVTSEGPCVRLN